MPTQDLGPPSQTIPDRDIGARADAIQRFELAVIEGTASGVRYQSDGQVATIGSHALCSLVVADPTVSRFHCEIRLAEDGARARDTGSLNGTVVDGVRIVEGFLRSGSVLRLGRTAIRFDFASTAGRLILSDARRFGELIGESTAMREVFAYLERLAPTNATVLLEGETGTGKTAAARSLHQASPRRNGPFVMVDCGAIPPNLLESELFGHERGSFTGADARRIGAFEEASGGTLFLDEIGELPGELQPKLLGVLENRSVRRIGGTGAIPVDVRLIAATNRDLRSEINASRFRPDLYFRLAVVRVELPPLRRRPEDIALLAGDLLSRLGAEPERVASLLDDAMVARLTRFAWRGNIRELRNYLERSLVFEDLPLQEGTAPRTAMVFDARLPFSDARSRAIAEFERNYLTELLDRHGGRVAEAAAAAGIDRTYFYRLLRRHGLATR
ncbi:MAG TPA: sigma 54-interacting transcriptional regulator [Kofleriaceae bacterium]|nr:sigma 54-interacting transcriptional regulator [Kofleriaceae bacterium]